VRAREPERGQTARSTNAEAGQAALLHHRRLEVNRRLGDSDGIAAATWDLAQIDLEWRDYQAAVPRLIESFQAFRQLQRADGIAAVGCALGELLVAAGDRDTAQPILQFALAAASRAGQAGLARQISQLLGR